MESNNSLAIFDFDNTITTKDTLKEFILYYFGKRNYYKGMFICSRFILLYLFKIISNNLAKEKVLTYFFKDTKMEDIVNAGISFSNNYLPLIIDANALLKINSHKSNGDTLVIISASSRIWFYDWGIKNGFQIIISTELEIKNGKLTGKIKGNNCYGLEKVKRLIEIVDLNQFNYIYVYGDSKGDYDLLKIADEGYLKFKRIK